VHRDKRMLSPSRIHELTAIHVSYVGRPLAVPILGTEAAGRRPFETRANGTSCDPSDVNRLADGNRVVR